MEFCFPRNKKLSFLLFSSAEVTVCPQPATALKFCQVLQLLSIFSVKRWFSRLPSKATGTVCLTSTVFLMETAKATGFRTLLWWDKLPKRKGMPFCAYLLGTPCAAGPCNCLEQWELVPTMSSKQGQRWTCQSLGYGERIRGFWQLKQYWWFQESPYEEAPADSQQTNRSQYLLPALFPP